MVSNFFEYGIFAAMGLISTIGTGVLLWKGRKKQAHQEIFARIREDLDLSALAARAQIAPGSRLIGFELEPWTDGAFAVSVRLDLTAHLPDAIDLYSLSRDTILPDALHRARPTRCHERSFDRAFVTFGEPHLVHAVLGKSVRQQLITLLSSDQEQVWDEVILRGGQLCARKIIHHDIEHMSTSEFTRHAQELIQVATAMSLAREELPARLCQELQKLQSNLYRAHCATHLFTRWDSTPETIHAFDLCRRHGVCELQLAAFRHAPDDFDEDERYALMLATSAGHANPKERDVAVKVLTSDYSERVLYSPDVPLFQRLLVIKTLTQQRPTAEVEAIVQEFFNSCSEHERREIIRQLTEIAWCPSEAFLLHEARQSNQQRATTMAFCDWLLLNPAPTQERVAVELLSHHREQRVRQFAIDTLAEVGTRFGIPTLARLSQVKNTTEQAALARAATNAITAIQARVGETIHGGITLVSSDGHTGGLTLAAEAGGLTPIEDPNEETHA